MDRTLKGESGIPRLKRHPCYMRSHSIDRCSSSTSGFYSLSESDSSSHSPTLMLPLEAQKRRQTTGFDNIRHRPNLASKIPPPKPVRYSTKTSLSEVENHSTAQLRNKWRTNSEMNLNSKGNHVIV